MALLDCFKGGELVETFTLSASKRIYKVGRQAGFVDIVLGHASISRQQATLTVSGSGSVVVQDEGSAQGTRISGKKLPPKKPHQLAPGRSLVFGQSTRIFKLREGSAGFITATEGGGAGAGAHGGQHDEELAKAVLGILRGVALGKGSQVYLRPDGFARQVDLLACPALVLRGTTAAALAQLVAATKPLEILERRTEGGEQLARATSGHAPSWRIDPSLQLVPFDAATLDAKQPLIHGAKFSNWNALRARGLGANCSQPIRLSSEPPARKAADVHVYVSPAALAADGVQLWVDRGASAAEAPPVLVAAVAPSAPGQESTLGVQHFIKVLMARDGSVLMSPDEIEPVRLAWEQRETAAAEAAAAAAAAAAARAAERERQQAEDASPTAADAPPARFNPYLAHIGMSLPAKASNRTNAAPTVHALEGEEEEEGWVEEEEEERPGPPKRQKQRKEGARDRYQPTERDMRRAYEDDDD